MSKVTDPSLRLLCQSSGQQAWSKNGNLGPDQGPPSSGDIPASIIHRIETSSCGPLLGADVWRPSILAIDPKSQQLFVAEAGQPRVKVFDAQGKYLRGLSFGGGVECLCVIPGEALVVVVTEEYTKSKMLGLKKEQFKLVNANVKPFLDFKPGFEFNVKGKHLADKKSAPAKFSIAYDSVGGRFLVADSSSSTFRCYSSSNGNFLWEKPQNATASSSSSSSSSSPPLLLGSRLYMCV